MPQVNIIFIVSNMYTVPRLRNFELYLLGGNAKAFKCVEDV